jgi:hypothetical protein
VQSAVQDDQIGAGRLAIIKLASRGAEQADIAPQAIVER